MDRPHSPDPRNASSPDVNIRSESPCTIHIKTLIETISESLNLSILRETLRASFVETFIAQQFGDIDDEWST